MGQGIGGDSVVCAPEWILRESLEISLIIGVHLESLQSWSCLWILCDSWWNFRPMRSRVNLGHWHAIWVNPIFNEFFKMWRGNLINWLLLVGQLLLRENLCWFWLVRNLPILGEFLRIFHSYKSIVLVGIKARWFFVNPFWFCEMLWCDRRISS